MIKAVLVKRVPPEAGKDKRSSSLMAHEVMNDPCRKRWANEEDALADLELMKRDELHTRTIQAVGGMLTVKQFPRALPAYVEKDGGVSISREWLHAPVELVLVVAPDSMMEVCDG